MSNLDAATIWKAARTKGIGTDAAQALQAGDEIAIAWLPTMGPMVKLAGNDFAVECTDLHVFRMVQADGRWIVEARADGARNWATVEEFPGFEGDKGPLIFGPSA